MNNLFFFKINNNKNNTFLSMSNSKGILLTYKSLKEKKTKDIKSKLTWGLLSIFKQFKHLKIKFLNFTVNNLNVDNIQQIFMLCKTWGININAIKFDLKLAHNGCRKSRKSRKRNKSRKKTKTQF